MKSYTYIIAAFLLTACGSETPTAETEDEPSVQATIAQPIDSSTAIQINCTGEIAVPPKAMISIHTPIRGIIQRMHIQEGDRVQKGQELVTLEHMDIIKVQEDYLKSTAQMQFWEEEFKRKETLFLEEMIPSSEYQQAKSNYASQKSQFQSLKKQISILGINEKALKNNEIIPFIAIYSPINGFITGIQGNTGMFIDQDKKILELVDDTQKFVRLHVFPSDIGHLRVGQLIELRVAGADRVFRAKVETIGKSVSMETKAIVVRGKLIDDATDLVVGTNVFAHITVE